MIRRIALAASLALLPGIASAQMAWIAPTPPITTNNDQIATTAYVQNVLGAGIPLASGKIFIGSASNLATPQTPSGDLTVSIGGVFTLQTVNANVGTFGSATQCATITTNAKGLITAASAATCTPAIGSVTGLGTGVATALGVNVGSAGAFVAFNGAGGTPSSITLTNGTGLPVGTGISGLGTGVATWLGTPSSANLAAALTDETGTGAAVFANSPALAGTPTAPTAAAGTNTTQIATTAGIVADHAATKTLTNTTLDSAGTGNVLKVSGVTISAGQYPGEPSTGSATAGNVGQYVEGVIPSASQVAITANAATTITSITLGAGDWDVDLVAQFFPANTTSFTQLSASMSLVTNTLDVTPGRFFQVPQGTITSNGTQVYSVGLPNYRFSFSTSTTIFMIVDANFTVSTMASYGIIRARRVR